MRFRRKSRDRQPGDPPLSDRAVALGNWYHRIVLPDGSMTPGDRDQGLVFSLYEERLPPSLTGLKVLDLGANSGGLTVEFARRGALVTAVEYSKHYLAQAEFVVSEFGLRDQVTLMLGNVYAIGSLPRDFDVVCYLGLSYHLRHPQLALDLISHHCQGLLLASSQTIDGPALTMRNRAVAHPAPGHSLADRPRGYLHGWEPTEELFLDMLAHAQFENPQIVSTSPHPGESPGRKCGNRTYCIAEAPLRGAHVAVRDERGLQEFRSPP